MPPSGNRKYANVAAERLSQPGRFLVQIENFDPNGLYHKFSMQLMQLCLFKD